mgnify:CR=1 FL=1|jgi:heat shock protein HslJ
MKKLLGFILVLTIMVGCGKKVYPDVNWGNNKKWIITELNGVPVQQSGTDKDAHFVFDPETKRVGGSAGCNRISGFYTIEKKNNIKFGEIASTKMACPDLAFEEAVLKAIPTITQFTVENNQLLFWNNNTIVFKLR